ncbi:MAG: thiamine pyrophosphate-dependent enzyme [Candidatus Aminicenantes bacterium]
MMFNKAKHIREKYIKEKMYPSIFCTGCGVGNVLNYALRAVDACSLDIDKVAFVSGIGCSSRLPGYIEADGLHTTHGRALAFATGIKTANPELTVIVFTGDGDLAAIGGNHFIHAARRNVDMTVICVNNYNYGMTGGQGSPTTPLEKLTTTTPFGNVEDPFDLSRLAIGAGAPYAARWCLGYPYETVTAVQKGIQKKGFSFIELLVPCPTGYGKRNEMKEGREGWHWYKKNTILKSQYLALSKKERENNRKIVIGELQNIQKGEFTEKWSNLVARARRESGIKVKKN